MPANQNNNSYNSEKSKSTDILSRLKELSPQELNTTMNVLINIGWYKNIYSNMSSYILATNPDIEIEKIEKIMEDIDSKLEHLGYGERLYIYNKLDEPFIRDFQKIYIKEKLEEKLEGPIQDPIKDINTAILSIHPDMDIKIINKAIKDTEEIVNLKNISYGEKWLVYNGLAEILIDDLVATLQQK